MFALVEENCSTNTVIFLMEGEHILLESVRTARQPEGCAEAWKYEDQRNKLKSVNIC